MQWFKMGEREGKVNEGKLFFDYEKAKGREGKTNLHIEKRW